MQPTYPLTAGLSLPSLRSAIAVALDTLQGMPFPPEWIDQQVMLDNGWPNLREALVAAHNPQEEVSPPKGLERSMIRVASRVRVLEVVCSSAITAEGDVGGLAECYAWIHTRPFCV